MDQPKREYKNIIISIVVIALFLLFFYLWYTNTNQGYLKEKGIREYHEEKYEKAYYTLLKFLKNTEYPSDETKEICSIMKDCYNNCLPILNSLDKNDDVFLIERNLFYKQSDYYSDYHAYSEAYDRIKNGIIGNLGDNSFYYTADLSQCMRISGQLTDVYDAGYGVTYTIDQGSVIRYEFGKSSIVFETELTDRKVKAVKILGEDSSGKNIFYMVEQETKNGTNRYLQKAPIEKTSKGKRAYDKKIECAVRWYENREEDTIFFIDDEENALCRYSLEDDNFEIVSFNLPYQYTYSGEIANIKDFWIEEIMVINDSLVIKTDNYIFEYDGGTVHAICENAKEFATDPVFINNCLYHEHEDGIYYHNFDNLNLYGVSPTCSEATNPFDLYQLVNCLVYHGDNWYYVDESNLVIYDYSEDQTRRISFPDITKEYNIVKTMEGIFAVEDDWGEHYKIYKITEDDEFIRVQ